jgi:hypothetical protein
VDGGEAQRNTSVLQEASELWRWSMQSLQRPAGSPIKTAENDFGRLPPPSNVNFSLINTEVTAQPRGRAMQASQSMPVIGVMKAHAVEDIFKKVAAAHVSEPRHGRRRQAKFAPHCNSTIHA